MATPSTRLRSKGFLAGQLSPVANKTPRGLVRLAWRLAQAAPL